MAGKGILIVEDEVATEGRPVQTELRARGYQVIEEIADTEKAAVEIALRERPDVVLMDIGLPPDEGQEKDEFAGLRAARSIQASTSAQIIFVNHVSTTKNHCPLNHIFQFPHISGPMIAQNQILSSWGYPFYLLATFIIHLFYEMLNQRQDILFSFPQR